MRLSELLFISFNISVFLIGCNSNKSENFPQGGYNYSESISKNDSTFYFIPLKIKLSRRDSILYANGFRLYQAFDEPNLSIRYLYSDIFRLVYSPGLYNPFIIKLTGNIMTIKIVKQDSSIPIANEDKLTKIEKLHFHILERRYPIGDKKYKPFVNIYLDSMVKEYPELLKPSYYQYLTNKMFTPVLHSDIFITTTKILTKGQYDLFINLLNNSGYWNMPYWVDCSEYASDGWGFTLEANTKEKYNCVSAGYCGQDDKSFKLKKACQKLIEYAGFADKIQMAGSE
jgi:hypothetical protein